MKSFILSTLLMRLAFGTERADLPATKRERGVDSNENCEALGCNYYPQQDITKLIKCTEDGSQLSVIFNGDNGCSDWKQYKDIESINNGCCRKGAMEPKLEDRGQESLIVGGTPVVSADSFPFIAYLSVYDGTERYDCTASIIRKAKPAIILTAAHCVKDIQTNSVDTYVRLNAKTVNDNHIQSWVSGFVVHPDFDGHTHHGHDVALLWLQSDISTYPDNQVGAVTLNQISSGTECCNNGYGLRVIGYGTSSKGGDLTSTLEYADVYYIPRASCNSNIYKYGDGYVKQSMLCAAAPGKDHCNGDSGGPLIKYYSNGAYEQVGVVSGSGGDGACADPNFPGYYADVGALYNWIQQYL